MTTLAPGYELSGDPARIDPVAAHAYLTQSYWAKGIPLETVRRALANSLCVACFAGDRQVSFARAVTDKATFAYLADVYVLEQHRGRGLSRAMLDWLDNHPDLTGLRRWMLATRDAHGLYAGMGWTPVADPSILMQRHFPDIYA